MSIYGGASFANYLLRSEVNIEFNLENACLFQMSLYLCGVLVEYNTRYAIIHIKIKCIVYDQG